MPEKAKVAVVGAGFTGRAIALALQKLGMVVTIIAERLPGDGINSDFIDGLGRIGTSRSTQVNNFLLQSYKTWMELAADTRCGYVRESPLVTSFHENAREPSWAKDVAGYRQLDPQRMEYLSYTFDPVAFGQWQINLFKHHRGMVEQRTLRFRDVALLRAGTRLEGYNYTVLANGLGLRDIRPDLGIFPARKILVHFRATKEVRSFDHTSHGLQMIRRPGGQVIAGLEEEYMGSCSESDQHTIGRRHTREASNLFSLGLEFGNKEEITVGYLANSPSLYVIESGPEVTFVGGLGAAEAAASPALGAFIAERLRNTLQRNGMK